MKHITIVIILMLLLAVPASGADEGHIGSIKTLEGSVEIMRQGRTLRPEAGARLFDHDTVQTGKDGSVGIILRDDTLLSLGPDSSIDMQEFRFDPHNQDYSLVCRMLRGTFIFISGLIAKLAPDAVKIETPDGTVAIRGTRLAVYIQN